MRVSLKINGKEFGNYIHENGISLSTIYRNQKSITTKSGLLYETSIEKYKYSVKLFDNLYDSVFSDLLSYLKSTTPAVVEYTEFKYDGVTPDLNYWEDIPTWMSDVEVPNWQASKAYVVDDFVKYNGAFYRCNTDHTSSSTFDETKWDKVTITDYMSQGNISVGKNEEIIQIKEEKPTETHNRVWLKPMAYKDLNTEILETGNMTVIFNGDEFRGQDDMPEEENVKLWFDYEYDFKFE